MFLNSVLQVLEPFKKNVENASTLYFSWPCIQLQLNCFN